MPICKQTGIDETTRGNTGNTVSCQNTHSQKHVNPKTENEPSHSKFSSFIQEAWVPNSVTDEFIKMCFLYILQFS